MQTEITKKHSFILRMAACLFCILGFAALGGIAGGASFLFSSFCGAALIYLAYYSAYTAYCIDKALSRRKAATIAAAQYAGTGNTIPFRRKAA